MANYTPIFEKPYPEGYEDLPLETTPVTAQTLNDKDDALEHIEDYLEENPIVDIEANPVLSGTEEALEAIKIGNNKYKVEGGGGGNANIWVGHKEDYDPDDPTIPLNALVCFDDDTEEIQYAEGVAF